MIYYGPRQLAESMHSVRNHTITIAEDIPEESYDYSPGGGSRSLREVLLHLVSMTHLDVRLHGEQRLDTLERFDFRAFFASLPVQDKSGLSKAEIVSVLRSEGERWCRFVEQLPESVIAEQVRTSRGVKTRFEVLLGTKEHEMHHRGQLMVFERLLGIVPHLTRNRQCTRVEPQTAQATPES